DDIRTWTYVSHRADWVRDDTAWQARTRAVEDKLSDALHDRLTQRFVDLRTTALVKGLRAKGALVAEVEDDGAVKVEGHVVGRLDGLRFQPAPRQAGDGEVARKALQNAALRALRPEIAARLSALSGAADEHLELGDDAIIRWRGAALAELLPGRHPLRPTVRVLPSDLMSPRQENRLRRDLQAWLTGSVDRTLGPLAAAAAAGDTAGLDAPVRGLLYRLAESLGAIPRREAQGLLGDLDASGRKRLARSGVRLGTESIYLDGIAGRQAVRLRGLLWCVWTGVGGEETARRVGAVARAGIGLPRDRQWPDAFYRACGYLPLGARAIACARAEALAALARKLARQGAFSATRELRRLAGGSIEDLVGVLLALGFQAEEGPEGVGFAARRRRPKKKPATRAAGKTRRAGRADRHSPFAKLRELKLKR
ncbi:MAG: disulfide oxidoreductase, partial [Alphaproteobacteria bacterium]|nr:disulfide oxidoreductase [Alphaproteobacteria bacterium]